MGDAKQSGVALPGSVVTVYYDDDESDIETFLIATRQEVFGDGKLEVYSPNSPLGAALLNAKRRDPYVQLAERQDCQGHAEKRQAVPLLLTPGTLSTTMARIAEDLLLTLLDNESSQPQVEHVPDSGESWPLP